MNRFCMNLIKAFSVSLGIYSTSSYAISNINVYYYNGNDNFINLYTKFLGKLSERSPINFKFNDAQNHPKEQVESIITGLYSGSPAIVNLVDVNDADKIMETAKDSGSRVVFFNRLPSDSALSSYDDCWYVGANSEQSGFYIAEVIDDYFNSVGHFDKNKNGQLDMVILQGEKFHHDTFNRTLMTVTNLKEKGYPLNVVSKNYDNWDRFSAKRDLLKQFELIGIKNIEIVVANNDAMALGALDALKSRGYNTDVKDKDHFIPVFGVDGLPEMLKEVDLGNATGTLIADYSALAKVCYEIATSEAQNDEEVTQLVWYKTEKHKTLIPYIKYASFKNYMKKKICPSKLSELFIFVKQIAENKKKPSKTRFIMGCKIICG